jgi:hypothetical protein
MLRRNEIEKLPSVSVGGKQYVQVEALLEAQKAKEAEATEAETQTRRAVPRAVESDAEKGKA